MITAQLICQGLCKQIDIIRVFGVSRISVRRSVKKYETGGVPIFFAPRAARTGGSVFTKDVKAKAQELLNLGQSRQEVSKQLGIKYDTLRKAINQGRLVESDTQPTPESSTKSQRSREDASASMGTSCTRPDERILASFGMINGAQESWGNLWDWIVSLKFAAYERS